VLLNESLAQQSHLVSKILGFDHLKIETESDQVAGQPGEVIGTEL
jgi:hypothetical protein